MRAIFTLVSLRGFLAPRLQSVCRPHARVASRRRAFGPHGQRHGAYGAYVVGTPVAQGPSAVAAKALEEDTVQQPPQIPLCERAPGYTAELASLLSWREAALQAISEVGEGWAQEDDGPSQADLKTELSWLLDDTVVGMLSADGGEQQTSWRSIERGLRINELDQQLQQLVQLRLPPEALEEMWRQRVEERVPLQYLTSSAHWRDVVLSVGPGILIPRPETEQIIDFVAEAVAANPALAQGPWADLGTGSGALAIGVARQLPSVPQVWAVDLSPTPIAYATFNAQRTGVAGRVRVLRGSWFEPLQAAGVGQLAGIVSNPPYVTSQQMQGLQAEVGRHEPHLALDGGAGLGIDSLVPICIGAVGMLQPGGFLALETGGGEQAHYIADVLRRLRDIQHGAIGFNGSGSAGGGDSSGEGQLAFGEVRVRRDLFGVDRFVTATVAGP